MSILKKECKYCKGSGVGDAGTQVCSWCDGNKNAFNGLFWFAIWGSIGILISLIISVVVYFKVEVLDTVDNAIKAALTAFSQWFHSLNEFTQTFIQTFGIVALVFFAFWILYLMIHADA